MLIKCLLNKLISSIATHEHTTTITNQKGILVVSLLYMLLQRPAYIQVLNRPGVAGAVLQTPLSIIDSLTQ